MQNLKKVLKKHDGSVLVSVVAFTAIMGICAVAYASLVRNTVSDEVLAYEDMKAYLAAEQGLLVATQWVGNETNWRLLMNSPGTVKMLTAADKLPSVNGLSCEATLKYVSPTSTKDGYMEIKSKAVGANKIPYTKTLSWEITGSFNSASGSFAGCFNDMSYNTFGNNGIKGLHNRVAFLGPVHSNSPILLSQRAFGAQQPSGDASDQGARFYGRVSTYKDWYGTNGNVSRTTADGYEGNPYWHNFGREYSQGVMVSQRETGEGNVAQLAANDRVTINAANKTSVAVTGQLDKVFRQGFDPFANKMELQFGAKDVAVKKKLPYGTSNLLRGTVEGTPFSTNTNTPPENSNKTVFLKFGTFGTEASKRGYYQYNTSNSGTFSSITPNSSNCTAANGCEYYDLDKETIIYAGDYDATTGAITDNNNKINVMIDGGSTLAGKVTLVTAKDRDIIFNLYKGDILYDGMTRGTGDGNNGGANFANTKDVAYSAPSSAMEGFTYIMSYVNTSTEAYNTLAKDGGIDLSLKNSGGTNAGDNVFGFFSGGNVKLNLFHPTETGNANQYNNTGASGTYRNRTITAQLFATNTNKKVYINENGTTKRAFSFAHVAGTIVMDEWWDKNYDVRKENAGIRAYHDKRKSEGKSLSAPGLKYVEKDKDNNILLGMRMDAANWKEENK
jgi:hypothetical protein